MHQPLHPYTCIYLFDHVCLIIGAIPVTDSLYAENSKPSVINSLSCEGTELELTECFINMEIRGACGRYKDAAVVCQGILR